MKRISAVASTFQKVLFPFSVSDVNPFLIFVFFHFVYFVRNRCVNFCISSTEGQTDRNFIKT